MKIVAYHRVSTDKQGQSGLGLEAQERAIQCYAASRDATVIKAFTEVESGKVNDRPQLVEALHLTKITGATLVIAKLDRLSRNAAFLLTLKDSGVEFVAADMPDANGLTVGIMALVAQQEREAISKRTKEALASVKARIEAKGSYKTAAGKTIKRLGNPNGAAHLRGLGNDAAVAAIKAKAVRHAEDLRGAIGDLRAAGITSLGRTAAALNERGILTPRGGRWYKSSVRNLIARLDPVPAV